MTQTDTRIQTTKAEAPIASDRTGEDGARPNVTSVSISLSRKEQGALYMKALRQADRIKELNATSAELTTTGQRFADLFEAFIRAGDDLVPEALRATTENDVVSAMYEFRGALSKVQQQPDCAREPGALTQPAISEAPVLTDDEIVKVLASLGTDATKSKYGFDVLQVHTTVPGIREIVAAYLAFGRVRDASAKADSADSQKGVADQPEQSK
jgi:hypothetical protein